MRCHRGPGGQPYFRRSFQVKLLLIGAGGVGVYFCGRAALGGARLEVVARSGIEDILEHGYFVRSIAGDFTLRPDRVLTAAAECSPDIDAIVLAVKVLPGVDRVRLLAPAADLPGHPPIVLIQNGIDIESEIAAAYPDNPVISTIAYIGVSREAPDRIVHHGSGRLIMGRYGSAETGTAEKIASVFRRGGVECQVTADIALERWRKLLWNLPFNTLSVLSGGWDTRRMCDGGRAEKLCLALMREVIATARAAGVPLTEAMAQDQLEYTRNFPAYLTSMYQDFRAGRPLEVEAIVGNVVRTASRLGVDVPLTQCCVKLLRRMDADNMASSFAKRQTR